MHIRTSRRSTASGSTEKLTADNGYLPEANVAYCEKIGTDAYIGRTKKDASSQKFPHTSAELYAKRKVIVEPVFGQIKGAMGFRRFSLRGLAKVPHEWGIVTLCHNILKLFRRREIAKLAATTS